MNDRWAHRWKVPGSDGHEWTVAQAHDGSYGCSCPIWRFKRQECHHIAFVKAQHPDPDAPITRPEYVLAAVDAPRVEGGKMLIPLVEIGNGEQEATIFAFLLEHGYSMGEVREMRVHVPREWTAKAIRAYVAEHGPAVFPTRVWCGTHA